MTTKEIGEAESISNAVIKENKTVYSKVVSLAEAKAVRGLRAVFDEVTIACFLNENHLVN